MKKIFLSVILTLSILFSGAGILAQDTELPHPGITPGSFFYFFEIISEEIGNFFTFGNLKKAQRYAALAAERIAEAQAVIETGNSEAAEQALKRYEDQLEKALASVERAMLKGDNVEEVSDTIAEATGKHLTVLEEVLEKVPEQAKESIVKAKDASMSGQKDALRALAGENPERATEINLRAVEVRLNRVEIRAEEGRTEDMEEAIKEFENQYKFGEEISQIAEGLGRDTTTVEQLIGRATSLHLEILADVYERVPEQAKQVIERAMEVSVKGHERTVESLKTKGDLDQVPEEIPMPESVSEEIKRRIESKVREELREEGIEIQRSETEIPTPGRP